MHQSEMSNLSAREQLRAAAWKGWTANPEKAHEEVVGVSEMSEEEGRR